MSVHNCVLYRLSGKSQRGKGTDRLPQSFMVERKNCGDTKKLVIDLALISIIPVLLQESGRLRGRWRDDRTTLQKGIIYTKMERGAYGKIYNCFV